MTPVTPQTPVTPVTSLTHEIKPQMVYFKEFFPSEWPAAALLGPDLVLIEPIPPRFK